MPMKHAGTYGWWLANAARLPQDELCCTYSVDKGILHHDIQDYRQLATLTFAKLYEPAQRLTVHETKYHRTQSSCIANN